MFVFFIINTSLHKTCGHVFRVQFSLGDKRSLSLGELIRPFCITILYVNSPLFIDIFHIRALYLCYFVVFCVFYSFTNLIIRVRIQLEKASVRRGIFRTSENSGKIRKGVFSEYHRGSPKDTWRGPRGHQVTLRRGPPKPRLEVTWGLWAPPLAPLWRTYPP